MYEPRTYRDHLKQGRFDSFTVSHFETDLWIALPPSPENGGVRDFILAEIIKLREEIMLYAKHHPDFIPSFIPLEVSGTAPEIVKQMMWATSIAGIGPMGSVAGAFSELIGKAVEGKFKVDEIVIENGGDIYLNTKKDVTLSIYAGKSPLSEKVGVKIPAGYSPLGVCTSAGTVGHSISFGKADAVMIACKNTLLADAYATAFGNKIKTQNDIEPVLDEIGKIKDILSAVIIIGDKMGIRGKFEMKVFK